MKMNPPASSNSPTNRKKPRIMRHLPSRAPETQSGISGAAGEIQPHQHLISVFAAVPPASGGPESVDPAMGAPYKDAHGGGRTPPAPACCPPPPVVALSSLT